MNTVTPTDTHDFSRNQYDFDMWLNKTFESYIAGTSFQPSFILSRARSKYTELLKEFQRSAVNFEKHVREHFEDLGRKSIIHELETLLRLPIGWDGYDGWPLKLINAVTALSILDEIPFEIAKQFEIVPSPEGDLQIECASMKLQRQSTFESTSSTENTAGMVLNGATTTYAHTPDFEINIINGRVQITDANEDIHSFDTTKDVVEWIKREFPF